MAELKLAGVSKSFGATAAVRELDLQVADGEMVVLLGPTGAGKTTSLRLIAGLEKVDAGTILIGGADVTAATPAQRNISFVFQQYSLYPHLSVYDNLAFPLRSPLHRMDEARIRERVEEIAAILHISAKLGNKATELSGGEMQRVSIGRSLVRAPDVYLLDEPLSSLDAKLRSVLRLEIKRIKDDLGATMVYVTHDQLEAMTMADRIGVLREGELVQIGTPQQIYADPADSYVAARLGVPAINLFGCDLLPLERMPPAARTVGVRTEHLLIEKAADGSGTIEWIEHLGNENHLHIAIGATKLVVLTENRAAYAPGDKVALKLREPLFFDEGGRRLRE